MEINLNSDSITLKTEFAGTIIIKTECGDILIHRPHLVDMPVALHNIEDGGSYKTTSSHVPSVVRIRSK